MKNTKEYILETSMLLFLQKSYRDVTLQEIVKKTGLSKGAFYHYFESKEDLFREIVKMFFSMGSVDYSSFSSESLKQFYNQYADFLAGSFIKLNSLVGNTSSSNGSFNFFLIIFEAIKRFPEFLEIELEMHRSDIIAWEKIISTARKNGEINSESSDEEIANLFLYCNDGVFIRYVNNDRLNSYKELLLRAYDSIYQNLKT